MALLDNIRNLLRPTAQKAMVPTISGGSYDYLPYGFAGVNQDIVFGKAGAAAAYTMVYEVNACIQSITNAIDWLDWNIKHYPDGVRSGEPGTVIANRNDLISRHPLADAMRNFHLTNNMTFTSTVSIDYELYGEVYIERVGNVHGMNKSLEWLNPLGVQVNHQTGQIDSFRYGWNMEYLDIPPERIAYLHNRNANNDFVGMPIVLTVLDEINIARNLDRFLRDYFANNARPGMIITPFSEETKLSDVDYKNILEQFRAKLKGVGGQYNTLVTKAPVTATAFEQPDIAKNSQLNDQQSIAIFEAFGLPRAMRGNTVSTPYKSGDEVLRMFYLNTILPLATGILQPYINNQIMPFFDDSGLTIFEFDTSPFDEITDADMLEAQVIDIQLRAGLIDLYTAAEKQEIEPNEKLRGIYRIGDLFVPVDEIQDLWEKQLLVAPSVYGAPEITGKPLPQPVPPEEIIPTEEGGQPVVEGEARDVAIEAEAEAEQEESEADEAVEEAEKSHNHDLLPHFKLYEGEYLFPSEVVIKSRLDRELHAWMRFESDRMFGNKKRTREFKTDVIPPWVRFEIIDRLDECKRKSDVVRAFRTVMDAAHIKTVTSYQRGLRELARGLWNDSVSIGQFDSGLETLIDREFRTAFVEGVRRGGLSVADLDKDEANELEALIKNEKGFIDKLSFYIYDNRKGVGKLQSVRSRVDMWVARYLQVRETGYMIAKGNSPIMWKYDKRKENCRTCAALNGQIRRAKFWRKSGIAPRAWALECRGFNCGCNYVDPPEGARISRGRLPRVGLHS